MVDRSRDAPRTSNERVDQATKDLEQLKKDVAKGADALRNDPGHILQLNPNSRTPQLVATQDGSTSIDSSLVFRDGRLEVCDPTGDEARDLSARGLTAEGDLTAQAFYVTGNAIRCMSTDGALRWDPDGAMAIANRSGSELRGLRCSRVVTDAVNVSGELRTVGGIRSEYGISTAGDVFAGFGFRGDYVRSDTYDGAIRWNPNGAVECVNYAGSAYRGIYATNFAPPPSWRAYKIDQRPLADYLGASPGTVIDRLDLASSWTYDPAAQSFDDGTEERIGPKLDEVPEALRIDRTDPDTGEDRSSWEIGSMLTVALAEIQSLRARVAELEARLSAS